MNRKLKTLIVEDDALTQKVIEGYVRKTATLELAHTCSNGVEAGNWLLQESVDLILLDVEMPEMSGFDLLTTLEDPPGVIIITSKKDYAVDAFDYQVDDFIVKPVQYPRFLAAVNRIMKNREHEQKVPAKDKQMFVKVGNEFRNLATEEIIFVESSGDYATIYTPKKRYTIHTSLTKLLRKLPEDEFIRVHRSYVVRLDNISTMEHNTIKVGDKLIPVGASFRKKLQERMEFLG
ncbi:MAG: LytTR family DNA-binding domain-containing protein [Bacteroidota bacterium]